MPAIIAGMRRAALLLWLVVLPGCRFDPHRAGEVCDGPEDCGEDALCESRLCVPFVRSPAMPTVDGGGPLPSPRDTGTPQPRPPLPDAAPDPDPEPAPEPDPEPDPDPDPEPPPPDAGGPRPVPPDEPPPVPGLACPDGRAARCIPPSDDVTVSNDANHVADPRSHELTVLRFVGGGTPRELHALLRFPLQGVTPDPGGGVGDADFFLTLTFLGSGGERSRRIVLDRVDSGWSEDAVRWSSGSEVIEHVGRYDFGGAPLRRVEIDVTDTVRRAVAAREAAVAFRLHPSEVRDAFWAFQTRDGAAEIGIPPYLEVRRRQW